MRTPTLNNTATVPAQPVKHCTLVPRPRVREVSLFRTESLSENIQSIKLNPIRGAVFPFRKRDAGRSSTAECIEVTGTSWQPGLCMELRGSEAALLSLCRATFSCVSVILTTFPHPNSVHGWLCRCHFTSAAIFHFSSNDPSMAIAEREKKIISTQHRL